LKLDPVPLSLKVVALENQMDTAVTSRVTIDLVKKYAPVFRFHPNETFWPSSIEYLLDGAILRSRAGRHEPISPVTQTTLLEHPESTSYLTINPSQFSGQTLPTAPLYYAVQEYEDGVELTYLTLSPLQGGQTVRALRLFSEFNCIIPTLGMHQGDLEQCIVTLAKSSDSYTIVHVGFEAHGKLTFYTPDKVNWEDHTHPIAHVNLNSHGFVNRDPSQTDHVFQVTIPATVAIGDWIGAGKWWRPHLDSPFKQLGLDEEGKPIGDQLWAAYGGRLGDEQANGLQSAHYFDGRNLKSADWTFVQLIYGGGRLLNKIPADKLVGNGPPGPGVRGWVRMTKGRMIR